MTSVQLLPSQRLRDVFEEKPSDIRVKTVFNGNVFITYFCSNTISYDTMLEELRGICGFSKIQPFTVKWLDEEGDPCTISSQRELKEAVRLHKFNLETELTIHVFTGVPAGVYEPKKCSLKNCFTFIFNPF